MLYDFALPRPHINQQTILKSKAKYKCVLAGRQFGKSLLCSIISIQRMLEGKKVAYITPTFHPLAKEFYEGLLKLLPHDLISKQNASSYSIELKTGGSIRFFSGESLGRFRGVTKISLLIIDEAAHIPALKDEFGLSIFPILMKSDGDIIAISTPNGREFLYSLYEKGVNGVDGWESWHFTTYDNPKLKPEAIENLRKNLTLKQEQQELLAIAGENQNNPFDLDAVKRNVLSTLSTEATVVYGIDTGFLKDYTAIVGLSATGKVTYLDHFRLPWELTQSRIEALPKNVLKVIDSTGTQHVMLSDLQKTTSNIIGFNFSNSSKTEIITRLIKAVEMNGIQYPEKVANEMQTFQFKYSSQGIMKYEAQSGYHDDIICAIAMALHYKDKAIEDKNRKFYFR